MISITTVVENAFCPKFTYYGVVLGLEQYEEKRGTVAAGRQHHRTAEKTNVDFVPSDLSGRRINSKKMYSKKHDFVGIIDHAIESDDEIVIIERKYSSYGKVGGTIRVQLGLLAILLEENYGKPVRKAHVIFSKGGSRTKIIVDIDQDVRDYALKELEYTKEIIGGSGMPDSHYDARCVNCCYRKVCDVGSLNGA